MKRRRSQQIESSNYQLQVASLAGPRSKLRRLTNDMRRGQQIHDHAAELLRGKTLRTLIDRTGGDDGGGELCTQPPLEITDGGL